MRALDSHHKGKTAKGYLKGLPSGYGSGVRSHYRKIKASTKY